MKSYRIWVGMAVLVSASMLTWVLRYGTAVILSEFRSEFHTDEAALGALAAAYFWPYALMQPFAGVLSDWWGPRRALGVWLLVAALGTIVFATAPNYSIALLGRALGGAGVGIVLVCAFALMSQWFPQKHFATVAGIYVATGPLGGLLATRPLAALVEASNWRVAFSLIAIWSLITALGVIWIPSRSQTGAPNFREAWAGLIRAGKLRNVWLTGIYAFVALGILSSMQGLWTIPFLTDVYGLDTDEAAIVLQAWSIGLLLALPAWGFVVDRLIHDHRRTMLLSVGLHALPWILLALFPATWPGEALFALFLYMALTNGCWMPAYALIRQTAPAAITGSALGLLNTAFFLGAAIFQQTTGLILAQGQSGTGQIPVHLYQIVFGVFVLGLMFAALALSLTRAQSAERAPTPGAHG